MAAPSLDIEAHAPEWSEPTIQLWSALRAGRPLSEIRAALSNGADPGAKNPYGLTALGLALRSPGDSLGAAAALLDSGAPLGPESPEPRMAARFLDGGEALRFLASRLAQGAAAEEAKRIVDSSSNPAPGAPGRFRV